MKKNEEDKKKKTKREEKSQTSEVIDIISPVRTARLINRSKKPGARELQYQFLRRGGVVFVRIVSVLAEGNVDGHEDQPGVGTWIKSLIPLEVFRPGLEEWYLRNTPLPATFLLPTERTKDFHSFPGPLRVNSTLRGHLVAIFRAEGLLREHYAPSTLPGGRTVHARAGYRSLPNRLWPDEYFAALRVCTSHGTEPWDPKRVYRGLQSALDAWPGPGGAERAAA
jgi:hypothetical protein